jgi:PAS domain S-box-containing protein
MKEMKTARAIRGPFERHPIFSILILGVLGVSAIAVFLTYATENLVQTVALENAELYGQAIEEFRTVYTAEVVARLAKQGIEASHDYTEKEHAIPLPATLSMILGRRIGEHEAGAQTHLYSPYPFPWREEENRKIFEDPFSRDAWEFLTENPGRPFYRFGEIGGRRVLRYARADLMRSSCVTCHNTHPDTPRAGWKVGDVRGVLQVDLPLVGSVEAAQAAMQSVIILIVLIGGAILVGTWLLISRIRRNEAELERAMLTDHAQVMIAYVDRDQRFRFTNKTYRDSFGKTKGEIEGRTVREILGEEAFSAIQPYMEKALGGQSVSFEAKVPFQENEIRNLFVTYSPDFDANGVVRGVAVAATETTRVKQLEEKLLRSQKLESFGTLAGGIAHDFNNMLMTIRWLTDLLKADIGDNEDLAGIERAAQHGADLTSRLLAFARQQPSEVQVVDLNEALLSLEKVLRRVIESNIELVILPSDSPCGIRIDPGQLEQVLLNLALNGRDAMSDGGKLTMGVQKVTRDGTEQAVVSVIDTGVGMSDEVQTKMFDPFFTTKEVGKGTGLGLSMCYGVVEQSGGYFEVKSAPGEGTTMRMHFPVAEEEARSESPTQPREETNTGTETILFVEDESTVRELGARILRENGYTVLEAGNGEEALSVLKDKGGSIDVMITDIVMPRMGGRELVERMRDDYPRVKILCTSGYAEREDMQSLFIEKLPFLPKPYVSSVLLRRIREVLGGG